VELFPPGFHRFSSRKTSTSRHFESSCGPSLESAQDRNFPPPEQLPLSFLEKCLLFLSEVRAVPRFPPPRGTDPPCAQIFPTSSFPPPPQRTLSPPNPALAFFPGTKVPGFVICGGTSFLSPKGARAFSSLVRWHKKCASCFCCLYLELCGGYFLSASSHGDKGFFPEQPPPKQTLFP